MAGGGRPWERTGREPEERHAGSVERASTVDRAGVTERPEAPVRRGVADRPRPAPGAWPGAGAWPEAGAEPEAGAHHHARPHHDTRPETTDHPETANAPAPAPVDRREPTGHPEKGNHQEATGRPTEPAKGDRPDPVDRQGATAHPGLGFHVLGPVRVCRDGQPLDVGSPQRRALLAALLLRRGRTATAPELIEDLWGTQPPDAAVAALRNHASRLRKSFGADADLLVSESGGYAMRVPARALDLGRAQELRTRADAASAGGDHRRAKELLQRALELWDGETLAGVPGPYAESERGRLEEWRVGLLESRLELDLMTGRPAECVAELTALTAAHPLRERLRELLMLALYRCGRQAEALAVYADTRRLLAEELGVDPRPELSALQQRILRADRSLNPPTAPRGAARPGPEVRPAQLPASVADFTGRAEVVARLTHHLGAADGSAMAVAAVAGIGGVGKTTLAVHVAHHARHHFPDGQLYVNLQGAGPDPVEPEVVLGSFLRALGIPYEAIPDGAEERAALYRSTLAGRRVLALLDNARDASQVRPLLPGAEGCAALVTSRTHLALDGALLVDLDVTTPAESRALFTRIVGRERIGDEPQAAATVVAACGHLPLAIRIAASRLATRRRWSVATLAAKLADERHRLDELRVGDLAVAASFELGYAQLDPAQARAFCLLGLPEAPDIALPAAAALLDLPAPTAEDLVESLVDASLLEATTPGRYRFHDLVRLYARARAETDHPPPHREAALSRLLDFYLATAMHVYALSRPGDRVVDHLGPTTYPGLTFAESGPGIDWQHTEATALLATARQLAVGETLRRSVDLLQSCRDLAESGAHSPSYLQAASEVLRSAVRAGDTRAEGRARTVLAFTHSLAGRFDQAVAEAERAMRIGAVENDPVACGQAANERGIVPIYLRQWSVAERYLTQALAAFRADGNLPGEASALANLSHVHAALGRVDQAVEHAARSLAIYRQHGTSLRLGNALYAYGLALGKSGRRDEALEQFTGALAVFASNRQALWLGMTRYRMAEVHLASDEPALAAAHAEQALDHLRYAGGDWRRATVLTALGRALAGLGQLDRARVCWHEALAVHERVDAHEVAEVRQLLAQFAAPFSSRAQPGLTS
ncbi:BTAD domain-containing putative transcriptional regulator [Streptomyces sp. NPDC057702]|uniref:BTAD domain-containing putative transcriptional regulator n=1 Tax=unclassified Streptomyces TaxID=2593676 RepID=UPI0036C8F94C